MFGEVAPENVTEPFIYPYDLGWEENLRQVFWRTSKFGTGKIPLDGILWPTGRLWRQAGSHLINHNIGNRCPVNKAGLRERPVACCWMRIVLHIYQLFG